MVHLQAIVCVSRRNKLLWSKQKSLGVLVANMTGRPQMNLSEAEYCGNLMDRHVREYVKKINKIAKTQRRRDRRHATQLEASMRWVLCSHHACPPLLREHARALEHWAQMWFFDPNVDELPLHSLTSLACLYPTAPAND